MCVGASQNQNSFKIETFLIQTCKHFFKKSRQNFLLVSYLLVWNLLVWFYIISHSHLTAGIQLNLRTVVYYSHIKISVPEKSFTILLLNTIFFSFKYQHIFPFYSYSYNCRGGWEDKNSIGSFQYQYHPPSGVYIVHFDNSPPSNF